MQDALDLPNLSGQPARPSATVPAIDPLKARILFSLLRAGAPRMPAVRAARIDYTTFKRAMVRGEKQREGEFRTFYDEVLYNEAMSENELVLVLRADAVENKNVSTAKYLLERRRRSRWAVERYGTGNGFAPVADVAAQDAGVQLETEERLARIEALKALALQRQTRRLKDAEPLEIAVVEPLDEDV